jgi:DNA-binding response OmpR family regulator
MKVLVVEDDRKMASFICKSLKAEGFAVDALNNGDEALASVFDTAYDGVVLDIMLAGRDGLSVLRQMRARGNRTPGLLLSARGGKSTNGLKGSTQAPRTICPSRLRWRS